MGLLPDILRRSRASSTGQKYEYAFLRWQKWATSNGLQNSDILPAKHLPVALYLASLIQTANTASPVIAAFYAIKHFHELFGMASPTDSTVVINVLEAAKRILARPKNKKLPITVDILSAMYDKLFQKDNIKSQRIIAASLLGFAGFMRSSELLNIRICDIAFDQSFMAVFVETSKTDQYRDGAWILIAKTYSRLCPVENVKKLIAWAGLSKDDYLLCNLKFTKKGYKVRNVNTPMSYTNLREIFMKVFSPHVTDIRKYCLHSLRSGGASAAANSGVKDRMFKRHGRWLSDKAKDGYVEDNLRERLTVSLSLGL